MILLDTNVLSELMRGSEATGSVVAWVRRNDRLLCIPSVAVGEIAYGVARLADGRRKQSLERALDVMLERFRSRTFSYDVLAAIECGSVLAAAEAQGRPMSLADAQIAATARLARAALATRNVNDFSTTGLRLVDPWTATN